MRGSWLNLFLLGITPLATCIRNYHYHRDKHIHLRGLGFFEGNFKQDCSSNDDCVSLCHEYNCLWLDKEEAEYRGEDIRHFVDWTQSRRRYSYYDYDDGDPKDGKLTSYAPGVCQSGTCHRSCSPRCPSFEFCRASDGLCLGPQPDGATCTKDAECQAFCVDGVCKARELGSSCEDSIQCDSRFCWSGKCRPRTLEEGEECDIHWVCASRACHNGKCVPGGLEDYEPCRIPEQCLSRYCPGECRPMNVKEGGRCHIPMQCESELCLQGTCGRKGVSDGGTCRDDGECAGFKCIYGKCGGKRLSFNDYCTKNSECETGYCKDNKCNVSTGQSCKTKDDCPGRSWTYCSSEGKCGQTRLYGHQCSATEQCQKGHCCVRGKCDNCPGGKNAACSSHSDCGSGLYCYKSIEIPERKECHPAEGGINSPCGRNNECRGSLQCRGGSCQSPGWTNKDGNPLGYLVRPFSLAICKAFCSSDYNGKQCQACIAEGEIPRYSS